MINSNPIEKNQIDSEIQLQTSNTAQKIILLVREITLYQLKKITNCTDISLHPSQSTQGYWVSLNMISNPDFRLTLKYYYKSQHFLSLAGESISQDRYQNDLTGFIKTFCFKTTELIAAYFERNSTPVEILPPVITKAFDEVFFPKETHSLLFKESWSLSKANDSVYCAVTMEIIHPEVLKTFRSLKDDVDFFSKIVEWVETLSIESS